MPRNVQICDNHVDNLKKNTPCGSCPVRPDLEKYVVDTTTRRHASMLFSGAVALIMGALVIVGWDYMEVKSEAREGITIARSNQIQINNHKEVLLRMTEGFEGLSQALNDLRVVIAKEQNNGK